MAESTCIPKYGKPINVGNLRPISRTSYAGQVMKNALYIRFTEYMEGKDFFPNTMFGFRAHLLAQDDLFYLMQGIINRPSGVTQQERAFVAMDFQKAFDNVRPSAILANLAKIESYQGANNFVRNFLHNRPLTIRAGGARSAPITIEDSRTLQGAIISPLLFNIALLDLPKALGEIPEIKHAIYADNVTISTNTSTMWQMEEALQPNVDTVEHIGRTCVLSVLPH